LKLETKLENESDVHFIDLDNDGLSEQILIFTNEKGYACLYVRSHAGKTIDQWNFDHFYIPIPKDYYISDVNNDGNKEVYVFTLQNDSIFLDAVDPFGSKTYLFRNRFIVKVNEYKGKPDFSISNGEFADLDGDSYKEIIFSVKAGFSLFPRKLFAYDYKNDTLISSAECGNVLTEIYIADLNNDGIAEIITNTWSPNNYINTPLDVEYHDSVTYLMAFDNKLNFLFSPIMYNYSLGCIFSGTIDENDNNYLVTLRRTDGHHAVNTALLLFDPEGNLVKETLLPKLNSPVQAKYGPFVINNHQIIVPSATGEVFFYNASLELTEKKKLPVNDNVFPDYSFIDINADGYIEVIAFDSENRMIIVDENFKNPVFYAFENRPGLSLKLNGSAPPDLVAATDQYLWFFSYQINPLYFWHYPIYMGIFLFILVLNYYIQKIQKRQIQKSFENKQLVTELQLKTIRNQMDPHFTFNAINSIASVIYDQDKDVAYDYFTKISKLIRATLDDADSITRTLDKEIEFVSNYLDIQKFRFSDKFDYNIKSGEYVNRSWKIPKMLIQIYAENAVKHGLIHNSKRGVLTIDLSKKNNFLVIEIVDNGIGRKKAMEIGSKSSGKGQKILQQYYSLFNQNAKSKIAHEIIDLKDADGKAAGTKVIIKVPVRT
jgi:hypothetical protein